MSGFVPYHFAGNLQQFDNESVQVRLLSAGFVPSPEEWDWGEIEEFEVDGPNYSPFTATLSWSTVSGPALSIAPSSGVVEFDADGVEEIGYVAVTWDNGFYDYIVAIIEFPEPKTGFTGFRPFGDDPDRQVVASVVTTSGVERIRAGDGVVVDDALPWAPEISVEGSDIGWLQTTGEGDAEVSGLYAVALGSTAKATSHSALAVGFGAGSLEGSAVAVGTTAQAAGEAAVAVGVVALAAEAYAVAVGGGAKAYHEHSIALGALTSTTADHQIAAGPRDIEIQDPDRGLILQSPDNTRWRITVDNNGALTTVEVS